MAQVEYELTIIRFTDLHLDQNPNGNIFIRFYVYAGGGRRIRIDTPEVPCTSNPCWNQTWNLQCTMNAGLSSDILENISSNKVEFELRYRKPVKSVLFSSSKLIGKAEIAWNDANLFTERQVEFVTKSAEMKSIKPPTLFMKMGISIRNSEAKAKKREHQECKCESCRWTGSEEDMFLAATMATI